MLSVWDSLSCPEILQELAGENFMIIQRVRTDSLRVHVGQKCVCKNCSYCSPSPGFLKDRVDGYTAGPVH